MTVQELIDELAQWPLDAAVSVHLRRTEHDHPGIAFGGSTIELESFSATPLSETGEPTGPAKHTVIIHVTEEWGIRPHVPHVQELST